MKVDIYTKVILFVIAFFLCIIAFRPIIQVDTVRANPGNFDSLDLEIIVTQKGGTMVFFDRNSGEFWSYDGDAKFKGHGKLVELGKDLVMSQPGR